MFSAIKSSGLPPEELRKSSFPWEAAVPAPGRKAFTGNLVQEVQRSREGSGACDLHPLSEEPAVGSQAQRGCAFSSRQVGAGAKAAASQEVTE